MKWFRVIRSMKFTSKKALKKFLVLVYIEKKIDIFILAMVKNAFIAIRDKR